MSYPQINTISNNKRPSGVRPFNWVLILALGLICTSCQESRRPTIIEARTYSKSMAGVLLEKAADEGRRTFEQIQEVRVQIMVLSMSLFITMLGFILTRAIGHRLKAFQLVLVGLFCLMMYGLDTQEADLSIRQISRFNEHKTALLQLDSLYLHQLSKLDTILVGISSGVELPDIGKKAALFISFRLFEWVWYLVPMLLSFVLAVLYYCFYDKKYKFVYGLLKTGEGSE